jgi:hypothetical protein
MSDDYGTTAHGAKRPSAGSALSLGCGTNPTAIAARCTVVIQVQEGARLKYGVHSYGQSVRENGITIGYRSGPLAR